MHPINKFGLFFGIFLLIIFIIKFIPKNTPPISLPKGAHHNTIDELPLVEMMDDGDFYEQEGDEDIIPQNCNKRIMEECKNDGACYLTRVKFCDDLYKKQLVAAAARGDFTGRYLVFMEGKYGSKNWACLGDGKLRKKYEEEFFDTINKETGDKALFGNQGNFYRGIQR